MSTAAVKTMTSAVSPFKPKTPVDRLMMGLDVPTSEQARALVEATKGDVGVYKIGMELQFAGGLELARQLASEGHKIFLDVKLHDIDNTILRAVKNVAKMGVTFMTLHAYPKTMRAAVQGLKESGTSRVTFDTLAMSGITGTTKKGGTYSVEGIAASAADFPVGIWQDGLTVEENLKLGSFARKDPDGVKKDYARVYDLFPRMAERRNQRERDRQQRAMHGAEKRRGESDAVGLAHNGILGGHVFWGVRGST